MLAKVYGNLCNRCRLLFDARYLTAMERLKTIGAFHILPAVDSALTSRITERDGVDCLSIGKYNLSFETPYAIVKKESFHAGVSQVVRESFVFPELFSSKVNVRSGDTVMDLGACFGTTALVFSELAGPSGKIIAVEPIMYQAVRANMERNDVRNVTVIPQGVSDKKGRTVIEVGDYCLDSSMAAREYTKEYYSHKMEIELTTIDDLAEELKLDRLDFIKIDIEGVEELAIRGAERVIKKFKPKWSVSSYHVDYANEPQHRKLAVLLKKFGYRISERDSKHIFAW
ncbi:FkbM family methyltransferase [bacterium]|nr:MAG: FkbM family methyltransferase [bacterium]